MHAWVHKASFLLLLCFITVAGAGVDRESLLSMLGIERLAGGSGGLG